MKAVLRGKFITLSAYMKKVEEVPITNLTEHLKTLEQKEADAPRSRQQEIN